MNEVKTAVKEAELLIEEVNTILNKAIANREDNSEFDRKQLRKIRDENINTYLLIQKMELVGLLE